jgi:hypothetical protein
MVARVGRMRSRMREVSSPSFRSSSELLDVSCDDYEGGRRIRNLGVRRAPGKVVPWRQWCGRASWPSAWGGEHLSLLPK